MIRFERRASTVLFNLLRAQERAGPVLVPESVCGVVPLVLMKLGRPVELIDISLSTLGIDHDRLLRRWSDPGLPAPAGLVYVRPYGHVGDTRELFAELRALQPDALIVDDRCLGFPDPEAVLDESADAILFSTGYAKCVELGHGGFAVTRETLPYLEECGTYDEAADRHWAEAVKTAIGSASRIAYDDSAWLDRRHAGPWEQHLRAMREAEAESRELKRRINDIYRAGLPRAIQMDGQFNGWRFNIWVRSARDALATLFERGLFASSHYRSVAPLFGRPVSDNCALVGTHILNLFNDHHVDAATAERTVDILNRCGRAVEPGPLVAASMPVGGMA